MSVPVKGTVITSSPCSLKESSKFLRRFLKSEVLPEEGLLRGYLTSVANAIEEGVTRHKLSRERIQAYEEQQEIVKQERSVSNIKAEEVKEEPVANGIKKESHPTTKRKVAKSDRNEPDSGSSKKHKKKVKKEK